MGAYVPQATVTIMTADPYTSIPRIRADQPFSVTVTVNGLMTDAGAPAAYKSVNFMHHVQSYGVGGTGIGINRDQATLFQTASIKEETSPEGETRIYSFTLNNVPGTNRAKVRGEERFTVMSLDDQQGPNYHVLPQVLASRYIQVWPVADGMIAGIEDNQLIRFSLPAITLTVNDVYPDSHTYAQVYKGEVRNNVDGKIVPGSSKVIADTLPQNLLFTLTDTDYSSVFDEGGDGRWTMELLTSTPFGIDRLDYVTFDLDRTIQFNGSLTTKE
ncbi:hypothetical protein OJ996_02405 [Luteolibacter sp. GHJ8]|uniref:Viral coat protein P2 N-terminal domain-containing protein n=2 Tax=Luteolibacter rhizosphaerae TaxID=2989719 RepID=A0ABT3FYS4_9BACT|nr:hypothetical protein [Luteolibacter rhizosphaerae]